MRVGVAAGACPAAGDGLAFALTATGEIAMAVVQRSAGTGVLMVLAPMLAALLAGCGPQSPEDVRAAAVAKCERQFGRVAPDPAKGAALCGCLVDRLADNGLEITDMLDGDRAKVEELGRSCARSAGVTLPQ